MTRRRLHGCVSSVSWSCWMQPADLNLLRFDPCVLMLTVPEQHAIPLIPCELPYSRSLIPFYVPARTHSLRSLRTSPARMRKSWQDTPVRWKPLPIAGGVVLLVVLSIWKQTKSPSDGYRNNPDFRDGTYDSTADNMPSVKGPWQVSCNTR